MGLDLPSGAAGALDTHLPVCPDGPAGPSQPVRADLTGTCGLTTCSPCTVRSMAIWLTPAATIASSGATFGRDFCQLAV